MTDSTELFLQNEFHEEMLGGLFFDIENGRMAVGAVKPGDVGGVVENRRRHPVPLGRQLQTLVECHRFFFDPEHAIAGRDIAALQRLDPVDFVAETSRRQITLQRVKLGTPVNLWAGMAFSAMLFDVAKRRLPVMAGTAEFTVAILSLANLRLPNDSSKFNS